MHDPNLALRHQGGSTSTVAESDPVKREKEEDLAERGADFTPHYTAFLMSFPGSIPGKRRKSDRRISLEYLEGFGDIILSQQLALSGGAASVFSSGESRSVMR